MFCYDLNSKYYLLSAECSHKGLQRGAQSWSSSATEWKFRCAQDRAQRSSAGRPSKICNKISCGRSRKLVALVGFCLEVILLEYNSPPSSFQKRNGFRFLPSLSAFRYQDLSFRKRRDLGFHCFRWRSVGEGKGCGAQVLSWMGVVPFCPAHGVRDFARLFMLFFLRHSRNKRTTSPVRKQKTSRRYCVGS